MVAQQIYVWFGQGLTFRDQENAKGGIDSTSDHHAGLKLRKQDGPLAARQFGLGQATQKRAHGVGVEGLAAAGLDGLERRGLVRGMVGVGDGDSL